MFQSTPPREGRLTSIKRMLSNILFQSTPPHEGRLDAIIGALIQTEFQSTPPRGRRQLVVDHGCSLSVVSIHAPARGATCTTFRVNGTRNCFNPRPHARGDSRFGTGLPTRWVSIHAPTRGATSILMWLTTLMCCFNPRPHARGDPKESWSLLNPASFNPRPPARGDFLRGLHFHQCMSFNPRPHARGDVLNYVALQNVFIVSIHAPTRGATSHLLTWWYERVQFQSTPPREGRRWIMLHCKMYSLFQSTPPREGRRPIMIKNKTI